MNLSWNWIRNIFKIYETKWWTFFQKQISWQIHFLNFDLKQGLSQMLWSWIPSKPIGFERLGELLSKSFAQPKQKRVSRLSVCLLQSQLHFFFFAKKHKIKWRPLFKTSSYFYISSTQMISFCLWSCLCLCERKILWNVNKFYFHFKVTHRNKLF